MREKKSLKVKIGVNDLETVAPHLLDEYSEKNILKPCDVHAGSSSDKFIWKCNVCGGEWKATPYERIGNSNRKGTGCPYCAGQKVLPGFNDLKSHYPNVAREWNYSKNKEKPEEVHYGSKKSAWFTCSRCGHEWSSIIANRTKKNSGCPECAKLIIGEKKSAPKVGVNDLATTHPELLQDWDYEKNEKGPEHFTEKSSQKAWWICHECGHKWRAVIGSRSAGYGCTVCGRKRTVNALTTPGIGNDFKSVNPELAKQWNYEKNEKGPEEYCKSSDQKVWWRCPDCGYEWVAVISSRVAGNGCPRCSSYRRTSFPEQALVFYLSEIYEVKNGANIAGCEVDILLPKYRVGIEYDGAYFHSSKRSEKRDKKKDKKLSEAGIHLIRVKEADCDDYDTDSRIVYFKPKSNYKNFAAVVTKVSEILADFTGEKKEVKPDIRRDRLKIEAKTREYANKNSFVRSFPEIAKEWDFEKNVGLLPEQFSKNSNTKVFWICGKCGTSWEAVIQLRTKKMTSCPCCAGRKVYPGKNDLATTHPELCAEWSDKNNHPPKEYTWRSHEVVNFVCSECGSEYEQEIAQRLKKKRCPYCLGKLPIPGKTDLASVHPELAAEFSENNKEKPSELTCRTSKKYKWKCSKCGLEYSESITNRINGRKCNICAGRRVVPGYNDLATAYPKLAEDWSELNEKSPYEYTPYSGKKVMWHCSKCGKEYPATISERSLRGAGCSFCAHRRVEKGYNDLLTIRPDVAQYWSEENKERPDEYTIYSNHVVKWNCSVCGSIYDRKIVDQVSFVKLLAVV